MPQAFSHKFLRKNPKNACLHRASTHPHCELRGLRAPLCQVRLESLAVLKQNGFSPDSTKRGSDADRADRAVFLVNSDRARLRDRRRHRRRVSRHRLKEQGEEFSRDLPAVRQDALQMLEADAVEVLRPSFRRRANRALHC